MTNFQNETLKCSKCNYVNDACILSFNLGNPYGNNENLKLLQCENCHAFTLTSLEDSWTDEDEPTRLYYLGSYTAQQAEMIFTFFIACRNYKLCKCEIHEAVFDWLCDSGKPIFDRKEMIEQLRSNPLYSNWQKEWQRIILPEQ